uniref:UBX domain protein 4 n=1 Tax=Haplochromis burtoni TaxID=8153 RepID=A0A3Q2WQW5_HAPBU
MNSSSQQSGRPANTVVQSSGGGIWAVLGTLLYPLLAVWRFLSSFPQTRQRGEGHFAVSTHVEAHIINAGNLSKHTLENRPKEFKKDGKVCRLRTQEDSEDDNNTWNGNSTQQM